jgi:hypothetical protein
MTTSAGLHSRFSPEELRARFQRGPEVVPVLSDPKFLSRVIALGIRQEVGTIHDELAQFLFDETTGELVDRASLRAETFERNGHYGVRIWSQVSHYLDPRVKGMRTLLHPTLSFENGRLTSLVIFPEIVARILQLEGAELVTVRPWGMNTVFGGFDPSQSYYEGNIWELVAIDALRYARLLEHGQIVFLGTHDFVSHISGVRRAEWPEVRARGKAARELLEDYFRGVLRPVPYTLVLPYALGILLDDLTQPMNYGSRSRQFVVELLMKEIASRRIAPDSRRFLFRYPPSYEKLIDLARRDRLTETQSEAPPLLASLVAELRALSAA